MHCVLRVVRCFGVLALLAIPALAGPLTPPPGPVASTPGPEPRIAINATNTPGDAGSLFKITAPGSYYLADNVTGVSGKSGISIASSNVTLDLNGFHLIGVSGSVDGITTSIGSGLLIRNGGVRNWGSAGIRASATSNVVMSDLICLLNGSSGIIVGGTSVLDGCVASSNGVTGITTGDGAALTACIARSNSGTGIAVGNGATLSHCVADGNVGNGIAVGFLSTVIGCVGSGNHQIGISGRSSCLITDCVAAENHSHGIQIDFHCEIKDNLATLSGLSGAGSNIRVTGSHNRIERNNCSGADVGIEVVGSGNIIIRNTCTDNTNNYSIVANNRYGPIINITASGSAAASGNSAASTLGTTDANANFAY